MASVKEGLRSQLRNIAQATGRPIDQWMEIIRGSGLDRHGQIVTMLKTKYGLSHASAHRLALTALAIGGPGPAGASAPVDGHPLAGDPADSLYPASKANLRAIHDRVMSAVEGFGGPLEVAPKKGYVSLRLRKQFAMLKPATKHVDLGLILPGVPAAGRLESAVTFNALFTHRVRVQAVVDVDEELIAWLRQAHDNAGDGGVVKPN